MENNDSLFWSAVGSFVGVIVFFLFRLIFEYSRTRKKFIIEYFCANELNQGQATESAGELMHHHGRRISDPIELKLFEVDNPIWEWTQNPVGNGAGASIIFGPYTTDFEEPGLYSVMFRMKSLGLAHPEEKIKNHILLELDVNTTTPDFALSQKGDIVGFAAQKKISRGYVRINHLAQKGWVDCELRFYSDAQGIWEYRILPYDGSEGRPNNLGTLEDGIRIVFDKITIYKIPKFQHPQV